MATAGNGAVVLYNYAWQMFLVPYAVLAIPIAVSAFPVLSARGNAELTHAEVDGAEFDATSAAATRGVLLVSWLGAALLAGAAVPAARLFASHPGQASHLALALAAFARDWSATACSRACPGCCSRTEGTGSRRPPSSAAGW